MTDLLSTVETVQPAKAPTGTAAIRDHMATMFSEANGYACLFEVANGTGTNAHNFADCVVMSLWPSRGFELHGYEFKVGRGDWLKELKQPDKAWPVMQYCDRWFLVSSPGVAKLDEIPLTWGWQEFDGEKLRVKKAAPALEAKPLSRTFVASMVRRPVRDVEAMARRVAEKRKKDLDDDFDRRVKQATEHEGRRVAEAEKKLLAVKEATGIDLFSYRVDDKAVAAALKFAMAHDPFRRYGGIRDAIDDVERTLNRLRALQQQVDEFAPKEAT